jgi:polar amino acid transport system substrate-binding protein
MAPAGLGRLAGCMTDFKTLRRHVVIALAAALALMLGLGGSADAQSAPTAPTTLKVAIKPLVPFVTKRSDGTYSGFSIDLWDEIARRNSWGTEYVWNETVGDLLKQVQDGRVDAGIAGISMTKEREAVLDFSYPMFNSGLQVMVGASQNSTWRDTAGRIFSPTLFKMIGLIVLVLFVAGNLVWMFNRHRDDYPRGYVRGVGEGMWWAGGTIFSNEPSGRDPSRAWSRIIAMCWIFAGIIFVANLTATISSQLTVQSIQGQINGVDDLAGQRVATVTGTTAEKELQLRGITVSHPVKTIDEAYVLLKAKSVDAIVYDAPVLLYRASHTGKSLERLVGPVFRPEPYGIAVPTGSPLREQIDSALLAMTSDGTYNSIYSRYFAPNS